MRGYGSKPPTKAEQRVALQRVLLMRDKPLDAPTLVSLSRSYGLTVSEIESIAAQNEEQRRSRRD